MKRRSSAAALDTDALLELAGERSFARGVAYFEDGRATAARIVGDRVTAVVRGTMPYDVELRLAPGSPYWSCSCPVGEEGDFCKHAVAVALSLLGASEPASVPPSALPEGADLEAFVRALPPEQLADLVLAQAAADAPFGDMLTARAAAAQGRPIDIAKWRRRIDAAFQSRRRFIEYRDVPDSAYGVMDALDSLEHLLEAGQAAAVITLAERAHRKADAAIQRIDDSDGYLTTISATLADLHLRACELAAPKPLELARRLVDLELTSELDAFHRAASTYATVLGVDGLAEYRHLVEPRWLQTEPAGDRFSHESFRSREAMIGIAIATRDPELLIRVKDLRSPEDHREIANLLREVGRVDEAIECAHRGLAAFPDRPHQQTGLRELLAAMLASRGDHAEAVEVFWEAFRAAPSLPAYLRLLKQVPARQVQGRWRSRMIAALRSGDVGGRATDASVLVEILLHEGKAIDAWKVARSHGCDRRLWLALARAREPTHPLDAIPIYQREAIADIETKHNKGYRSAVKHLDRIRVLAEAADKPARFTEALTQIKVEHKPKRNLMALFAERGW